MRESGTAAVQRLGLDNQRLGQVLAVVERFNRMNRLADGYQLEPEILPLPRAVHRPLTPEANENLARLANACADAGRFGRHAHCN